MKIFLSLVFSFLLSTAGIAQTFNGTGGAIPDNDVQTCFNVTVSGVGTINSTYGLATVCLNITHSWDSDLSIVLVAPDGTQVVLSANNGGSGSNYATTCFNMS